MAGTSARLTGVFWDREAAERAYQALRSRGFSEAEVNLMMSAATRERFFGDDPPPGPELGRKALEGAGVGTVTGGVIVALAATVAGLGLVLAGPRR